MEYLKEKFSVSYGSKKYRENWEKIFGFNPKKDCELYSTCEESDKCENRCDKIETTE